MTNERNGSKDPPLHGVLRARLCAMQMCSGASSEGAGGAEVAGDDGVSGAKGLGEDGRSGVGGGILREGRRAEDEEIGRLPMLEVRVDDGGFGRGALDGAALDVAGLVAAGVVVG